MSHFYKLFQFGHEFEKTHESRVQIIRHGRVDSGVKIASEATDYIANVEPELGKTFVLVLAMSASEYYGPNRNGDAFSERPVDNCVKPGKRFRNIRSHLKQALRFISIIRIKTQQKIWVT